jgi:hypothetical protein
LAQGDWDEDESPETLKARLGLDDADDDDAPAEDPDEDPGATSH